MFSTQQVLSALRRANPDELISEDRIRHALRGRRVAAPTTFAGRLAWGQTHIQALARFLGVEVPDELIAETLQ